MYKTDRACIAVRVNYNQVQVLNKLSTAKQNSGVQEECTEGSPFTGKIGRKGQEIERGFSTYIWGGGCNRHDQA